MTDPDLSVIIPAYNEATYLPRYLPTVFASLRAWEAVSGLVGEVIVVNNASTDDTATVAKELGARVVTELVRSIGLARNTGARMAEGRMLFFVDADVALPLEGITAAVAAMEVGAVGGAIPPLYTPARFGARLLCAYWDHHRSRHGGAQGVNQFCTRDAFKAVHGYRPDYFMSEDMEFFARLTAYGRRTGGPVAVLEDLRVRPSTRRYDAWSTARMLWWQNPVVVRLGLTSPRFWRNWYTTTVR
ncbi:glycosyltransferase [Streptomyces erythrochromogenes]|uniref:glycosyltransferase n=1 Tax=Streptomyces erythrochromogenes TaxID=285574 RepID=UPI002254274C|nr:glycosyltransferase [Streptomyces erythrochromogenes]MCX5585547.1 glycosyltransferase [Streptomyces erythrochromogenes]